MADNQAGLPVDQVRIMRDKGFDNNQIVQALQRNGYSSTQIFDALNQADLVSGTGGPAGPAGYAEQAPIPPERDSMPVQESAPGYAESEAGYGISNQEVEELVESVIDEKWDELSKDINQIVEWKNEIETKVNKLEQRFVGLKDEFDKLYQALIGKIGEYDKNILSVGAEVKAMEKVFSKVLPVFTENINELDRITNQMKKTSK